MSKWSTKAATTTVTTVPAGAKVPLLTTVPGNAFITVANIAADTIFTNAFQAKDAGLTSISGLTTAADKMIYTTALDTYAVADLSAFARTLLDDSDASTARGTLGLVIGTDVQAYDADLTTWAGLTPSANAQSLVTAANYAAMRTLLDVESGVDFDPAGTDNSTDVTLAGSLDYLSLAGQVLTLGSIDLTTDVTGVLPSGNIGAHSQGASTITAGTFPSGAFVFQGAVSGITTLGTGAITSSGDLTLSGADAYTRKMRVTYGSGAPDYYYDFGYKSDGNKVFLTVTDGGVAKDVMFWRYNGEVVFNGAVSGITTLTTSGSFYAGSATASSWGGEVNRIVGLDASGNGRLLWFHTTDSSGAKMWFTNATTGSSIANGVEFGLDGAERFGFLNYSATDMYWGNNNAIQMTLSSAGNLDMTAGGSISAPRINGSTGTGTLLLYGDSGATVPLTISDTGAVSTTGTLASGALTVTGTGAFSGVISGTATGNSMVFDKGSANNVTYARWINNNAATRGDLIVGIESTAAATFTGTSANSSFVMTNSNTSLHLGANAVIALTLDSSQNATFTSYLQGTTANGFLDLRGDSGATSGVRIKDNGGVVVGGTTQVGSNILTVIGGADINFFTFETNPVGFNTLTQRNNAAGGTAYGQRAQALNASVGDAQLVGADFYANHTSSATTASAIAVNAQISNSGGGTVSAARLFSGIYNNTIAGSYGIHLEGESKNYFSGTVLVGTTTDTYGKFQVLGEVMFGNTLANGFYTSTSTLNGLYNTNSDAAWYLNNYGYQGGTTQFRDLVIGTGKNTTIATFDGSAKNLVMATGANIDLTDGQIIANHQFGSLYTTSAAATTITVPGTYYKAAGTTTTTNLSDFSDDTGVNNRLKYTGAGMVHVHIAVTISFTCSSNNQYVGFRVVKNGAPTATDSVASMARQKIATGADLGSTAVHADIMLSTGDYVELWTTNETSTASVTVDNMYFFGLAMRTA